MRPPTKRTNRKIENRIWNKLARRKCESAATERVCNIHLEFPDLGRIIGLLSPTRDNRDDRKHADQGGVDLRTSVRFGSPCFRERTNPALEWAFLGPGNGLVRSTREGFATQACDLSGFACEVTAAAPGHVGACRAGMVPAPRREPHHVAESQPRPGERLQSRSHADGARGSVLGRRGVRRDGLQRIRRRREHHRARV